MARLHRISPQLPSSLPVPVSKVAIPTLPLLRLRHAVPFRLTLLPALTIWSTVGNLRRNLASTVRHGDIPVPTRLVVSGTKQPDDAHVAAAGPIPALREDEVEPD